MTTKELALEYFRLSNERELDKISELFRENTTYSSDKQGLFLGREQIMTMMRGFFAGYQSLHWEVESCELVRDGVAELVFSFEGVDSEGQDSRRRGVERIVVFRDYIQHIEVRAL